MTPAQADNCKDRTTKQIQNLKLQCGWKWDPIVDFGKWSHDTKTMPTMEGMIKRGDIGEK